MNPYLRHLIILDEELSDAFRAVRSACDERDREIRCAMRDRQAGDREAPSVADIASVLAFDLTEVVAIASGRTTSFLCELDHLASRQSEIRRSSYLTAAGAAGPLDDDDLEPPVPF
jgi:hypothetical protein